MSVAKTARFLAGSTRVVLAGIIGWLLIAPIALLTPRRRDLIAVIGMSDGSFIDNAKYFFLQASPLLQPGTKMVFVSGHDGAVEMLARQGLPAVRYPSFRAIRILLRCSVAVVDSGDWLFRMRRFLLLGAKTVQLWHGVGFKRIGFDKMRNEPRAWLSSPLMMWLRILNGALNGKLVHYSAVVSTSTFYEREVFRNAIPGRYQLVTGYPRNTFGQFGDPGLREAAWLNVEAGVREALPAWTKQGRHIVLVAPTFRDSRPTTLGIDASIAQMLDDWCERHCVEMVFKFHPFERATANLTGTHLHLCDAASDIYPLLPLCHALVTDYSSIYMDYLLVDKPVVFLVPDVDEYVRQDRQFQFDFQEMTPGPKVETWPQVLAALEAQWQNDGFIAERARLRQLAFDNLDQREAVPKLIAFMHDRGWIKRTSQISSGAPVT